MRIFIADDQELNLKTLGLLLESEGHAVVAFSDGVELWHALASAIIEKQLPDLVISDVQMPIFSGLDVAAAMQASRCDVPLLLLSGAIDERMVREAHQLGVTELLAKPVSPERLLDFLQQLEKGQ